MKFAKELERDLVPEWRAKYLDYKAGKKRVKAVARAIARANATPKSSRLNPRDHYRSTASPYLARKAATQVATRHRASSSNASSVPRQESRHSSDESDQGTKPILLANGGASNRADSHMQYGSFVPTPPSDFNPEQLELPAPALKAGREGASGGKGKTLPRGSHRGDEDGVVPGGSGAYSAYTVGEMTPARHRTAIGSIFHHDCPPPALQHAGSATMPNPREPVPLMRRLMSHAATIPHDEADVNMVPLDHVRSREVEFFKWMDGQLEKVESFYKQKEDEAGERLNVLREQLHEMRNRRIAEIAGVRRSRNIGQHEALSVLKSVSAFPSRANSSDRGDLSRPMSREHNGWGNPVEKAFESLKIGPRHGANSKALRDMHASPHLRSAEGKKNVHGMDPARDYVRKAHEQDVPYRSAKRKLKLALKEYYRGLELLKSYALLNRTAFRKINKKYDKAANAHPPLRYMTEKVNKSWFVQSDVLDGHLHAIEDLYARYFERGNHKVAMGKLRSATGKPIQHTATAFRSGLLIGTGAVFGIQGLINAATILRTHPDSETQVNTGYLLQIYGGYLLALYLFAFFCIDCSVWVANKINYVFIFEFDPRNHLDWRQLAEFPAFLTLLLGMFVWLNFSDFGSQAMYLYYPVVLIFITVVAVFLPAPVLFHRSRRWFAYSHWRLLLAGLYPVEFRDFFLGDMYCSLTYVTANIEVFFCLYAHSWDNPTQCNSSHSRLLGFFTALPGIWRALQCLRRYYDTRAAFPHLANFGKYSTTILYYVFLSQYRIQESHTHLALFITFAAINSIYSAVWDLLMDWSLLQPSAEHRFLRPVLSYKSPWYYYAAMAFDVLLRFNWIFYAIFTHNTQHSTIASFLISFSEANRRGVWTLFRVENEHAANVLRFKASRDVPLPYKLRDADQGSVSGDVQATVPEGAVEEEPRPEEAQRVPTRSLRRVPSQAPSPRRAREEEEGMAQGMRRRMTLTRIMADAHMQDFEKRRVRTAEGAGREGRRVSSEDEEEVSRSEREDEEESMREEEQVERVVRRNSKMGYPY